MTIAATHLDDALSAQARSFITRRHQLLVGDGWADARSDESLDVVDPVTEQVIGHVPAAGRDDVDAAVASARAAFDDGRWRDQPAAAKTRVLLRLADLVEQHVELLAELDAVDVGKPMFGARMEVGGAADHIRNMAGWPSKIYGELNPSGPDLHCYTRREPYGVCAAIIPWNCPLANAVGKLAPALATGNSVVLKPAEQTNLSALLLGQLALEAGLPPGVLQIVTGPGETVGDALVAHPGTDKISFTGSTDTGRAISRRAADRLKPLTLELGGKTASLVFPDADLQLAAGMMFSPYGVWYNSTQACVHATRMLVHESVYDDFVAAAAQTTAATIRLGSPLHPETTMGPLVSEEQFGKVMSYLDLGRQEGADVVCGGGREGTTGYFVNPTLLAGVERSSRINQEEIFGPVVTVDRFADEDEAVAVANATDYGLAASIWTSDLARAHRLAARMQAGLVWVNSYAEMDFSVSFGGYKQSGVGREYGLSAIETYTQRKGVYARLAPLMG